MARKRLLMLEVAAVLGFGLAAFGGAREAASVLEEEAKARTVSRQAAVARSRTYLEVARRLYDQRQYRQARDQLQRALYLDPENKAAAGLLEKVNATLGVRPASARTALEQLGLQRRIAMQQKIQELENCLVDGQELLRKARGVSEEAETKTEIEILTDQLQLVDRAVDLFERAREIMKWMPYEISVGENEKLANELLAETRKTRREKLARLQEVKARQARKEIESRKFIDRELEMRKIERLVDQVQMLFDQEEYEKAEELAEQVLTIDPGNERANELWLVSREEQHRKREAELKKLRREELISLDEKRAEACVPYAERMVYPDDWDQIRRRESVAALEAAEPEWKQQIRKQLQRKVTFEFVETSLQEAISFLQTLTNVTIILDTKAFEGGGAPATPITLRVNEMPLNLALRWILRLADLDYTLKDEAIFISTSQRLAGEVELKIYDVRDLTYSITQFPGPELVLTETTGAGGAAGGLGGPAILEEPTARIFEAENLADMIRLRVRPDSWSADLGTSIQERDGKLVVMQRPEVHRLISQLLNAFRETQTLQVLVQVKFIEVRDSFLEDIGVEFADLPAAVPGATNDPGGPLDASHPFNWGVGTGDTPGVRDQDLGVTGVGAGNYAYRIRSTAWHPRESALGSHLLSEASSQVMYGGGATFQFRFVGNVVAQAILHALKKERKGDLLLAPRVTMYNNQRAYVMVATQRAYISDYDISGGVYDPVLSTILEGTVLDVRPTVSHDRRYITLNMRPGTADQLDLSNIEYIQTPALPGLGAVSFPIQLPSVRLRSVRTTATVPDGGTVLISGLMTDAQYTASAGVPFFSDLPVIGRLFGTDVKQHEKINLLMMVSVNLILFEEEEIKL